MEEHQSDEEDQDQLELRDYQESRNRVQRQTKVRYMGYRVSNDRNTNTTVTTGNSLSTTGGGISAGTQYLTSNYRSSSQMGVASVSRAMSQNRGTWNQQQNISSSHNAQPAIMNMVDEEEQSKDPNGKSSEKYRKSKGEEKQRSNSNNYRLSNTIINDAYGDETIEEALEYVSPYTIMNECGYTIEIQAQED